jgi:oxygen-independent coproporphyrinogen-3 oxidase
MRTVRHRKPENFLSGVRRNGHGIVEEEPLTAREASDEALVMGLRLSEGIDVAAVEQRFAVPVVNWSAVEHHSNTGLLEFDGGRIRATPQGRLVLDSLLAAIAA